MAFDGLIDAITGPSFKMPDGTVKQQSLAEAGTELLQNVGQEATVIIDNAKSAINEIKVTVGKVAEKAIPAAIAACASMQYTGGQGTFSSFLQPATFREKFFLLDGDKHAFVGWPCHQVLSLSNLSGFTQCRDVKLAIGAATIEEQQIIKDYMERGFFIE